MSSGSHNPEKLEAAFVEAITAFIYKRTKMEWWPGTDQENFETIEAVVASLAYANGAESRGPHAVFKILMELPGVSSDALDRFHEMFR